MIHVTETCAVRIYNADDWSCLLHMLYI
jgi:hypothetical protein